MKNEESASQYVVKFAFCFGHVRLCMLPATNPHFPRLARILLRFSQLDICAAISLPLRGRGTTKWWKEFNSLRRLRRQLPQRGRLTCPPCVKGGSKRSLQGGIVFLSASDIPLKTRIKIYPFTHTQRIPGYSFT